MNKQVILITGTPCVGKTTIATELSARLKASYVNLTELAKQHNLVSGEDTARNTIIIDENRMCHKLSEMIDATI